MKPDAEHTPAPHEPDRAAGRLLARVGVGEDSVEVMEDGTVRWLQFAGGAIQSLMHRRDPDSLVLPYTRALLAWLLFVEQPRDALLLGLGGGTLVRWMLARLPDVRLTVVEADARVLELARDWFRLPAEGRRLCVDIDDARRALARLPGERDLVLLDVFDAGGMPAWLSEPAIYAACASRLGAGGVFCANLWARDEAEFLAIMGAVRAAFDGRALCMPVSGYYNLVVLGFEREPACLDIDTLTRRAQRLAASHHVEFAHFLEQLVTANLTLDGHFVL